MIKMKAFSVYLDELTGTYPYQNWSEKRCIRGNAR